MVRRLILHESRLVEIGLVLLTIGLPIVSLIASLETCNGEWFQRSGSLMVLFSVAIEHRRRERVAGSSAPTGWLTRRHVPHVCYSSILVGTLIWGYGDLLLR